MTTHVAAPVEWDTWEEWDASVMTRGTASHWGHEDSSENW